MLEWHHQYVLWYVKPDLYRATLCLPLWFAYSNHYTFNMLVWVYFPNFLQCDSLVDSSYRLVKGTPLCIHSLLLRSQYDVVSFFCKQTVPYQGVSTHTWSSSWWYTFPMSYLCVLDNLFFLAFFIELDFLEIYNFSLPFQIVWGNYCCLMWPNHKWVNIWAMIVH